MSTVVPLRGADAGAGARLLARAFAADPFMVYLFPRPAWRRRVLPVLLGSVLRYCRRYGEVATTDDLAGVACWLPPGSTDVTPPRRLRTGMTVVVPLLGPGGRARFHRLVPAMEQAHAANAPGPHWYLWLLGAEPSRVGHGIGSTLLTPVLERSDRAGLPVYLNTHREDNLAFYGRHGFEPVAGRTVDGLTFWGLRRDPRRHRTR